MQKTAELLDHSLRVGGDQGLRIPRAQVDDAARPVKIDPEVLGGPPEVLLRRRPADQLTRETSAGVGRIRRGTSAPGQFERHLGGGSAEQEVIEGVEATAVLHQHEPAPAVVADVDRGKKVTAGDAGAQQRPDRRRRSSDSSVQDASDVLVAEAVLHQADRQFIEGPVATACPAGIVERRGLAGQLSDETDDRGNAAAPHDRVA